MARDRHGRAGMTKTKRQAKPRYTGPQAYDNKARAEYMAIRARYPEAERIHGEWCGPGFGGCEIEMRALERAHALRDVPPCAAEMACLCAGHARGNEASAPCDTREAA